MHPLARAMPRKFNKFTRYSVVELDIFLWLVIQVQPHRSGSTSLDMHEEWFDHFGRVATVCAMMREHATSTPCVGLCVG